MLISQEYLDLQRQFHAQRNDYGIVGHTYADDVLGLAEACQAKSILDYGAGKGTLQQAIMTRSDVPVINYDPCIDVFSKRPPNCDLVACTDVLEHIEIECLDNVLSDLVDHAERAIFLAIHIGPAKKTLPDGRNAHLIQEAPLWWLSRVDPHMEIDGIFFQGHELKIFGRPK